MTCRAIISGRDGVRSWAPAAASGGYGPAQLRGAYEIAAAAARNGGGKTIAIVDAFSDPNAAADLSHYRSHFQLGACATKSGCLKILNQSGRTSPLPSANAQWATEESLDLDMVSAICPKCRIMLIEAKTDNTGDLGTAENTAIAKGVKFVSNSWSGSEFVGQDEFNQDFNHPGHVIDFASGDTGYATAYPNDLQYVTSVGGTSLRPAHNKRGWTETAWGSAMIGAEGTASGCSVLESKPSWQLADASAASGCLNRTENDVSADANPATGVLIYDSYRTAGSHLFEVGGTSAATPILTGIYALAGQPAANTYPARYPYLHSARLFDVTTGVNGKCESFRQYLCHGEPGYDGPTGLGTPDGTAAFTDSGAHRVTLVDPGTQDLPVGSSAFLTITGLDTAAAKSLQWSATGLPPGLAIGPVSNSTNSRITGTLPDVAGTFAVTVTARDGSVSGSTAFNLVVVPSLSGPGAPALPILLAAPGLCLDGGALALTDPVTVQTCGQPTSSGSQAWTYTAGGQPDDTGTIAVAGNCLSNQGTSVVLGNCTGALGELWAYQGFGDLLNLATGKCLNASRLTAGGAVNTTACRGGNSQSWSLPAGPIIADGLCLNSTGAGVQVGTCAYPGTAGQLWGLQSDGTITDHSGLCLAVNGLFSATAVKPVTCDDSDFSQLWEPGPAGELINLGSGRCLNVAGNIQPGAAVEQTDCYGSLGEAWGLN